MRKVSIIFITILISAAIFAQITTFEHRNITNAPEAMEIIDSFLVCAEGKFIEVYNADGDTLVSRNIIDFGEYVYDIKYDDRYIFISPWFLGDSVRVFYRDSLPSLVEYSKLCGFLGCAFNDTIFVSQNLEYIFIYEYDTAGHFNIISENYLSAVYMTKPVMILDTLYLPKISIADPYDPYELSTNMPSPYIIEDTIMYGFKYPDMLGIFNIADINNIILIDTIHIITQSFLYESQAEKQNMLKIGDYLYVNFTGEHDEYNRFMVFDVSDITDVQEMMNIETDLYNFSRQVCNDLAVYQDKLYFGRSDRGLQVYELNDTASPVIDHSLGVRPLDCYWGIHGTVLKPFLFRDEYYLADKTGIFSCIINDWDYISSTIPVESLAAFAVHDSIIAYTKLNDDYTETFRITDLYGNGIDSVKYSGDAYAMDQLIMIDDYIYLKHCHDSLNTNCAIYQRDVDNHLQFIDSFDVHSILINDYEIMNDRLVTYYENNGMYLFDVSTPNMPVLLDSVDNGLGSEQFGYLAHCRNLLFAYDVYDEEILCYDMSNDSFEYKWSKRIEMPCEFTGIEYCNGYVIAFPNFDCGIESAMLYTFDETGILDSVISNDFSGAFGQAVVESNYVYFAEYGSMFNRVRVGDKKQECIVLDSMNIGQIASGDSLMFSISVFNNGDAVLTIDSVLESSHTYLRTSLPVTVPTRDSVNVNFITYQYPGDMNENIRFYTDDIYDIYNETVIHAEQVAGIDVSIDNEKEKPVTDFASVFNGSLLYSISGDREVKCKVFDVLGRTVFIYDTYSKSGRHTIEFSRGMPCGIYFIEFSAGDLNINEKTLIIK